MPLAKKILPPLLLLGAVAVAAFGVFSLLDSDDEAATLAGDTDSLGDPDGPGEEAAPEPTGNARGAPSTLERQGRGLPRVLPPDAAVEDVRDALALHGDEREAALSAARASISRLAVQGVQVLNGLRSYAATVEDPVVRGVVVSALGSHRGEEHVRWLGTQLAKGRTDAERIGALIALAQPAPDSKRRLAVESATSTTLAGLRYTFVALPASMSVLKSGARFLDAAGDTLAEDALPVLARAIRTSPAWATLLAVNGEKMCAWYGALSDDGRRRVRVAALEHPELAGKTRATIEAAR